MTQPAGDDEFRSHWFAFPIAQFLHDREPDGPPLSIELRPRRASRGGSRFSGGEVRTRLGDAPIPRPWSWRGPRSSSSACSPPYLTPAEAP